jgi:16S rRNA processing protein RimM
MALLRTPPKSSGGGPPRPGRQHFGVDDVRLGYVSGVFGLRGDVRLFLYNPGGDVWDASVLVTFVGSDGSRAQRTTRASKGAGKRIFGHVDGVGSVDAAQALVGCELVVARDALPDNEDGAYYHRDLLGLPVRTTAGRELGLLAEIYSASDVDTWVVRGPDGETYLPALQHVVLAVLPGDHILVDDGFGSLL